MTSPNMKIPTVAEVVAHYNSSDMMRRRAMQSFLRALNADQSGGA